MSKTKTYTILIEDLCLSVIIGILDSERETPQKLIINAKITYKLDNKKTFLDYVLLKQLIQKCLLDGRYGLLEEASDDIIKCLKKHSKSITHISLSLKKPHILDDCIVGIQTTYTKKGAIS